jgi:hypothetical protein
MPDTHQRVIVTALKNKVRVPEILDVIEHVVQQRSKAESLASSMYTLFMLSELSTDTTLAESHLDQAVINACLRAVCVRGNASCPSVIKFGTSTRCWKDSNCTRRDDENEQKFQLRFDTSKTTFVQRGNDRRTIAAHIQTSLQEAQRVILGSAPPGFAWPNDNAMTQVMNAGAARYRTILVNNLFTTLEKHQSKTVRLQLSERLSQDIAKRARVLNLLTTKICREINQMDIVPTAMYSDQSAVELGLSLYTSLNLATLVTEHTNNLDNDLHKPGTRNYSRLQQHIIAKSPHLFIRYHHYLARAVEDIRERIHALDPDARLPKAFNIFPQLKPKARCMDISSEQLGEILRFAESTGAATIPWTEDHKLIISENSRRSGEITLNGYKTLSKRRDVWTMLFTVPKDFCGTLTTDGVRAIWHTSPGGERGGYTRGTKRKRASARQDDSDVESIRPSDLVPKHYGLHGHDMLISKHGDCNLVFVDPGHATLIHAVKKQSQPRRSVVLTDMMGIREYRRTRKREVLNSRGMEEYTLTNGKWRSDTKKECARLRHLRLFGKIGLQSSVDRLAQGTAKSTSLSSYSHHVALKLETHAEFENMMKAKAPRRWKLDCYQAEQRAAEKLCSDLSCGYANPSLPVLVVWGAGSFGPTSRGHASAPNKRLQSMISRRLPLVLCNEYRTRKRSCCCHSTAQPTRHYLTTRRKKRATVLQCSACSRLLSRDGSAACLIGDIFEHQRRLQSSVLPGWTN